MYNITFPQQVCVALLIHVFHHNIGHKCCGWLNYAHFKQTLNLMSFSSCSGHRLIRGKGIWQEEGNKRKVSPPSSPWPNSREHSSLQPPHRYSWLQKYWLYKPFAPQPARSICGRAAHVQRGKEQHKEHNNAFNSWRQDQSARHGALPSQWGNFSAGNGAEVHQSSICWHGQQAQPKLSFITELSHPWFPPIFHFCQNSELLTSHKEGSKSKFFNGRWPEQN